ncbi:SDR family oxidoreductase [Microvirga brassicacearum]|uniref:SDR family oxidoreductase n=1 Tax=Microvirga brassicacearum TaxID=2580413 RepID=A0A5N3P461_9HYPH|nr:SDR family oxidoreductase [Microvirga brassicacearum]KAB0264431.1 SDR family oxidoreductase [Microvirga brassicacearum]
MNPDRLKGRIALITGGSRGIGRAVAERFAFEGATVAINHVRDDNEAALAVDACTTASINGGHVKRPHRILEADVSSAAAVDTMMAEIVAAFGRLDILVNNAGIQSPTPGDVFEAAELERIIGVNLLGAAYCARAAIRHFLMRPEPRGVIINTSSVHEVIPKPGYLAYSMSKGGLGNLTRTLALEFADRGIRVNGVGPGAILTSLNDSWRNDPADRAGVERHIPMGYAAAPDAIAPVFAFLASDEAAYMTGQTLFADGGLTLYGDFRDNWAS